MLKITVGDEAFDEETQRFVTSEPVELLLEHSLVSLSKWESEHEKPFLGSQDKTLEETIAYIRAMIISDDVSPEILEKLTGDDVNKINDYITAEMSATRVSERDKQTGPRETVTAELIYYWMISLGIPFECQYWHLNRLLTLIKVCNIKNSPPKKRSFADMAAERRRINEQRKAELKTRG